jgi:hypothetical protein
MFTPLKVAVIGAGSLGMHHARRRIDIGENRVELVGVAEQEHKGSSPSNPAL